MSKLLLAFDFILLKIAIDLGESGMRYFKQFVECFPVPPITSQNQPLVNKIGSLVTQIVAAKKQNPKANTSALEMQIDQLVYQLYGLTPEEIAVVEGTGK